MSANPASPRFDDRVCFVCARPAVGLGYAPNRFKTVPSDQIAWCCDDPECLKIASETYAMKQLEFGRIEHMATEDGGAEGGAYLDKIGKSDLATLTEQQWHEFLTAVIGGYRAALKGRLRGEAPF